MAIEVCLEHNEGNRELLAWVPDRIGCAAFGLTEPEAVVAVLRAVAAYDLWAGADTRTSALGGVTVVERVVGDEVLFDRDRLAASPAEIERTIDLLARSRAGLLDLMRTVPEAALDWDPPYERYLEWASWRTIREVLAHVAVCETGYYLRWVGHDPSPFPRIPAGCVERSRAWYAAIARDWEGLLRRTREETEAFLRSLVGASDRARVTEAPEGWSVRKALRRLVWHERLHTKSIARIVRDFGRVRLS